MTSQTRFLSQITQEHKVIIYDNSEQCRLPDLKSRFWDLISVMAGIMGHGRWIHALAHSLCWPGPLTHRSHIHQVVNGSALDERIQGFLHTGVVKVDARACGDRWSQEACRPGHTSARRPQSRPRVHHAALRLDGSDFGHAGGSGGGVRRLESGGLRAEAGRVTLRLGRWSGAGHWRRAAATVEDAEDLSLELLLLVGGGGGGHRGQVGGMKGQAVVCRLSWSR